MGNHNSSFGSEVGYGIRICLTIGVIAYVGVYCNRQDMLKEAESNRLKSGQPTIYQEDLNNDGKIEEFCKIGEKMFFSVVDGKSLESTLK